MLVSALLDETKLYEELGFLMLIYIMLITFIPP